MNYISQIKGYWLLHQKHALNITDTALYFYLLEVCNSANWVNQFKRNNARTLADLKISRSSLERSRKRLSQFGILSFKSVKGTANITYRLIDFDTILKNKNISVDTTADTGSDATVDAGTDGLNKNSKLKQVVGVVSCEQAFAFFVETKNNRLLKDRFNLDNNNIQDYFRTFYDSKVDLGDLNNKTTAEAARNFYYWLPKHLAAAQAQKEKSCAKKERYTGNGQSNRGVAAALQFAGVKMRGE